MGDPVEKVLLASTNKRLAAVCLAATGHVFLTVANGMKDPITGMSMPGDALLEVFEFVADVNDLLGNEPSPTWDETLQTFRDLIEREEHR